MATINNAFWRPVEHWTADIVQLKIDASYSLVKTGNHSTGALVLI